HRDTYIQFLLAPITSPPLSFLTPPRPLISTLFPYTTLFRSARALHRLSRRRDHPFSVVNCPALSEELLASEMFGHAKGAFTGAVRDRPGRVEAAEGGTLFLDEVGEIPPAIQAKLLRFLQDKQFERL